MRPSPSPDPNGDVLTFTASGLPPGPDDRPGHRADLRHARAPPPRRPHPIPSPSPPPTTRARRRPKTFRWTVDGRYRPPASRRSRTWRPPTASSVAIGTAGHILGDPRRRGAELRGIRPAGEPHHRSRHRHHQRHARPRRLGGGAGHDRHRRATLDGLYAVTVTASDGQGGSASQTFTLDVANQAPVVVARTADQTGGDGAGDPHHRRVEGFRRSPTAIRSHTPPAACRAAWRSTPSPATSRARSRRTRAGTYAVTVGGERRQGRCGKRNLRRRRERHPAGRPGHDRRRELPPTRRPGSRSPRRAGSRAPTASRCATRRPGCPRGLTIDPDTGLVGGTLRPRRVALNAPATTGSGRDAGGHLHDHRSPPATGRAAPPSRSSPSRPPTPRRWSPRRRPTSTRSTGSPPRSTRRPPSAIPTRADTLTYAATGLPGGLTIDPASGLISGTIAAGASMSGPYAVTVTATDDKGRGDG